MSAPILSKLPLRGTGLRARWRRLIGSTWPHPEWKRLLKHDAELWREARARAAGGPRVLLATSMGMHYRGTSLDSALGIALTLRGARVEFLLCDEFLPGCQVATSESVPVEEFVKHGPQRLCGSCFRPAARMLAELGLPIRTYGEFEDRAERARSEELARTIPLGEISSFTLDGMAVGEHATAGALRYFARASLDGEPHGEQVLRRYFAGSLRLAYAARRLFQEGGYEVASFAEGIYVPQGIIGGAARRSGVRIANYNMAYRKSCYIFSHGDSYHHTLLDEPEEDWRGFTWSQALEDHIMEYLHSRVRGTNDWLSFLKNATDDVQAIEREVGVDFSKPCIGMFTNVMWDAQLHFRAAAFPTMLDWVLETIRYFARRPDLQLVIRVHPAEVTGLLKSRQPLTEEIHRAFPELPRNVFVVPPESKASTYLIAEHCNAVLIYATKMGVELPATGMPVIVAGQAWVRNKGVTMDASSREEFLSLLDQLPLKGRLDQDTITRARRYAYHFFYRRMIPLQFMLQSDSQGSRELVPSIRELLPGVMPGLDVVCDGILTRSPFVYPAETIDHAAEHQRQDFQEVALPAWRG